MSPAVPRTDHTHVLLLRGINVGRAKRVAMPQLREMAAGLGAAARALPQRGDVGLDRHRDLEVVAL